MFQFISNFFRRIFGAVESQESKIKRLATAAGILVGANNAKYIGTAKLILATVSKDGNESLANGLFQKLFSEVIQEAKKPEQKAALAILFSELNFSPDIDAVPDIQIPLIKSAVVGFLEGMTI